MIQAIIGVVEFFVALGLFTWGMNLKDDREYLEDLKKKASRMWEDGIDKWHEAMRIQRNLLADHVQAARTAPKKKRSRR